MMKKKTRIVLALMMIVSIIMSFAISSSAATMPSCSGQKVSNRTSSSFRFDFTIKNPSRVSVPQCGVQIRPKGGNWSTHTENIVAKHRTLASCPVWYEVGKGKEFNYTLNTKTAYEVRGFCKYGGKTYYSGIVGVPAWIVEKNPSCSGCKGTSVNSNGFKLEFTINNPSKVSVPECGARIRKKNGNSWTEWKYKSESIVSNHRTLASIPVWYQVGSGKEFNYGISANSTYEIQGYCKFNGQTFWSNTATVQTPPVPKPNTNGKTADQAISWCKSKVGQGIEADGSAEGSIYYKQCVDLIKAYYSYLGVTPVKGNGSQYASNALPSGWTRIRGAQPRKGDILVYSEKTKGDGGHVAIYESDYVTYHQRFNNHPYVERITNVKYNSNTLHPYWGVIRPNFS